MHKRFFNISFYKSKVVAFSSKHLYSSTINLSVIKVEGCMVYMLGICILLTIKKEQKFFFGVFMS